MEKLIEAVPNFSEGKNLDIINQIIQEIESVSSAVILHVDSNADANRTVITFVADAENMAEAASLAIGKAAELIDMSQHKGVHPRIGATDVFPLIPLKNTTIEDCISISRKIGEKVARDYGISGYFYEESAYQKYKKNLADCRKGEYEGILEKLMLSDWKPDFGKAEIIKKSGLTVIGARHFLIAYNINLNTKSVEIAKKIAGIIRNERKKQLLTDFDRTHNLTKVKAIGWFIDDFNIAQVSTNIIDFEVTSLAAVFEKVSLEAQKLGIEVTGSELIGLIPEKALLNSADYYLAGKENFMMSKTDRIKVAIKKLGLNQLAPFSIQERVLEFNLNNICKT